MKLEDKIADVFAYTEERCLWQYYSRTWDREENIEGVVNQAISLLTGKAAKRIEPMDKLHYADAKIMVDDLKHRLSWIGKASEKEILEVMEGLKAKLVDATITRSTNRELTHRLY